MDVAEEKIFHFCDLKKFRRYQYLAWSAIILMFALGGVTGSISNILLGVVSGLSFLSVLKPEKLVESILFAPEFLEIKTLSGFSKRVDFKDLRQIKIFPMGSNRLVIEGGDKTIKTYSLGWQVLSKPEQLYENRIQFNAFSDSLNQQLTANPNEMAAVHLPKGPSNLAQSLYSILSFLTGALTLITGILIFLGGIAAQAQSHTADGNSFFLGSVITFLGILAGAKKRWVFILLALFVGYRMYLIIAENSPNSTGAKILIATIGIMSLLSFVLEYFSRRSSISE